MAHKKNDREIKFTLNDEDYRAFGRYRILYTKGGRKLVMRQRLTYLFSGIIVAVLFTVFHVDPNFTKLAYIVAAVIGIGGFAVAERLVLRQQDNAIVNSGDSLERVHPEESSVTLNDDEFITRTGDESSSFAYKDIKLIDLTEEGIYIWMSDTAILPLPLHAFKGMPEMKETYKWIQEKIKEQGGDAGDEE